MPVTLAGTKELIKPDVPLPWQPRESHPELFEDGSQYLVALQVRYDGGPCYWEYSVVRIKCDGYFIVECNDEPWGWEWPDVEFFVPLRGSVRPATHVTPGPGPLISAADVTRFLGSLQLNGWLSGALDVPSIVSEWLDRKPA